MIACGGEQMMLRVDACNLVRGVVADARNKLAVLRGHCDAIGRDYAEIEKNHVQAWILARDDVVAGAKRERLADRGPLPRFVGTVSEAIDLIGQYLDAGIDLLIYRIRGTTRRAVNSSSRMSCITSPDEWPGGIPDWIGKKGGRQR